MLREPSKMDRKARGVGTQLWNVEEMWKRKSFVGVQ